MSDRTMDHALDSQRLHQLRVFAVIVEQGSVTGAARELGISKSVVSGHLKRLEAAFGVRLIERTTRQMALTGVGESVYEASRRMLDAGEAALAVVEAERGSVTGVVRLSCPIDLGPLLMVPLIARLREAHPGLRVEVLPSDMRTDLIADGIDLSVRLGPPPDSGLIMRRLRKVEEWIYASPALADEYAHVQTPMDLAKAPWVAHSVVFAKRRAFTNPVTGQQLVVPRERPAVLVGSSDLLRAVARDGHGFVVLPTIIGGGALSAGLQRVCAPWIRRTVDLYAVMPSRSRSRRREVVMAALVDVVDGLD